MITTKIVKINLNEINDTYSIEDIEGFKLTNKRFIGENSDNPQLILIYSSINQNNIFNLTDRLYQNKKINNEKIIDLLKNDKSKLMLYYYLRSKRVVIAYTYKIELFEVLTNEGLYTLINSQIKTSVDFNSHSVLKKFKMYKDVLLKYCKDFYDYQLPEEEETYNKLAEYYIKEWNHNLDIQREELKTIKSGNLLKYNIDNPNNENDNNNKVLKINNIFIPLINIENSNNSNNNNNATNNNLMNTFNNLDVIQDIKINDVNLNLL